MQVVSAGTTDIPFLPTVIFLSVFSFCYWYATMLTAFILWTKPSKEMSVEMWLFLSLTYMGTVLTSDSVTMLLKLSPFTLLGFFRCQIFSRVWQNSRESAAVFLLKSASDVMMNTILCISVAVHSGIDFYLHKYRILLHLAVIFSSSATTMSFTMATFRTHLSLNASLFLFLLVGKGGISSIDLLPPNLIFHKK